MAGVAALGVVTGWRAETSPAAAPSSDASAGWASLGWILAIVALVVVLVIVGMSYLRRSAPRRAPSGDQADHGPGEPQEPSD